MALSTLPFLLSAGAIPGQEHRRLFRNCQDALELRQSPHRILALVADGCSSGAHSEVGAWLAVRWLASRLASPQGTEEAYGPEEGGAGWIETLLSRLTDHLFDLALSLCSSEEQLPRVVQDYFLFTLLGALVTKDSYQVFGLGDGIIAVNGHLHVLEAGEGNAPPYLGYRLVERAQSVALRQAVSRADLQPVVHVQGSTSALNTLLIATDGAWELEEKAAATLRDGSLVGGLSPFLTEERYGRNPSLIAKRLRVIGELNGHLMDDCTLAVIRRKEESAWM